MTWADWYDNRWRNHVGEEEQAYVDKVLADENASEVETMLAKLIKRLAQEVEDANDRAWEEAMGEDL